MFRPFRVAAVPQREEGLESVESTFPEPLIEGDPGHRIVQSLGAEPTLPGSAHLRGVDQSGVDEDVDVLRIDDSGCDDDSDEPNAIRGLPRVWTATWQRLSRAAPPAVALVHGEGVQATAKAVAADLKRAAAAAASLASMDGAYVPPMSYEQAQLEQAVDVLKGWRWRGTTSTKLSYLLSRLTDPALADEKAIVFTNHNNVLYYICQALTMARIRHLWFNTQLPPAQRAQRIFTFNSNPHVRVFVMITDLAGTRYPQDALSEMATLTHEPLRLSW